MLTIEGFGASFAQEKNETGIRFVRFRMQIREGLAAVRGNELYGLLVNNPKFPGSPADFVRQEAVVLRRLSSLWVNGSRIPIQSAAMDRWKEFGYPPRVAAKEAGVAKSKPARGFVGA